jgi:hypothetical protein
MAYSEVLPASVALQWVGLGRPVAAITDQSVVFCWCDTSYGLVVWDGRDGWWRWSIGWGGGGAGSNPVSKVIAAVLSPVTTSGQISWLLTQRSGFDSRRYQIF